MNTNIKLSERATAAINGLRHKEGTYKYYDDTLSRMFHLLLDMGDELGMSDTEILHDVRAISSLRLDLAALAADGAGEGSAGTGTEEACDEQLIPMSIVEGAPGAD